MHRGKVHDYLWITIDFTDVGKVIFSMNEYVERLINEAPEDLMKGSCTSPAAYHIFGVNKDCAKLDPAFAILFHHITAELLYLGKRTRPDLQLAI